MSCILAVYTVCAVLVLSIPSLFELTNDSTRKYFIVGLIVVTGFSEVFMQLNILVMFKGGFRVAVCMVFSFVYLFAFGFEVASSFVDFVGNGVIELIVFVMFAVLNGLQYLRI